MCFFCCFGFYSNSATWIISYGNINIIKKKKKKTKTHSWTYGVLQADASMAMDTDSNVEEEVAEESRDGQEGPSPCSTYEEASTRCPSVQAVSAPSSPPGTQPGPVPGLGPDSVSLQKAGERPSSLPPSSPRALTNNDWAYHSAVCPAECQHPGMQIVKGIHTNTHRLLCSLIISILFHVQV